MCCWNDSFDDKRIYCFLGLHFLSSQWPLGLFVYLYTYFVNTTRPIFYTLKEPLPWPFLSPSLSVPLMLWWCNCTRSLSGVSRVSQGPHHMLTMFCVLSFPCVQDVLCVLLLQMEPGNSEKLSPLRVDTKKMEPLTLHSFPHFPTCCLRGKNRIVSCSVEKAESSDLLRAVVCPHTCEQ